MSTNQEFESDLAAFAQGEIPFDEFLKRTRGRWRSLAEMIVRKWKIPAAGSVEDIEQELIIQAWQVVPEYDPERAAKSKRGKPTTRVRHACFSSMVDAKRAAHKLRGAPLGGKVHPDKHKGRAPLLFSQMSTDEESEHVPRAVAAMSAADPEQSDARASKEALQRALDVCTSKVEQLSVLLVDELGSIDLAADAIWGDKRVALALRLQSRAGAGNMVRAALKAVAHSLGAAEA